MRKKLATIGVVIMMLGVAMGIAGFTTIDKAPANDTITTVKLGEYRTDLICFSNNDILIIANPGNTSGLIKSSYIGNTTNYTQLEHYSIKPTKTVTEGYEYENLKPGDYIFIIFSSSKPENTGFSLESHAEFVDLGYAEYAFEFGILAFFAGIVVLIIGFVLKPKPKKVDIKPILKRNKKK